jgi:hypothetical protein
MEVQSFPLQQLHEVVFPVLIILKALDVVFQIIRQTTDDEEVQHNAECVSRHLDIDVVPEEPVTIKEDGDDEHAECFKKI